MASKALLSKGSFLNFGVAFFLFALTQLKDALKEYSNSDGGFKLNMTLFTIFIIASALMFGIHIGLKIAESQISKKKTP